LRIFPITLAFCAAIACGASPVRAATVQVTLDISPGKAKIVRLRRVPTGTLIGVTIDTSGTLVVALQSAAQLGKKSSDALFRGALEHRLSFEVSIPQAGDYYLVLDNRHGVAPVKATATIKAVLPKRQTPPKPAPSEPKGGKFEQTRRLGPGSSPFVLAGMPTARQRTG
jgi:hypothetical protein